MKRRGGSAAALVGVASLGSAGVNYLVMWLGARTLAPQDTTYLLTFLSVLFLVYGVLSGIATETTRSVARGVRDADASGPRGWSVALVAGGVAALAVLTLAPWWQARVLHGGAPVLTLVVAGAALAYAFHSVLVGALAGGGEWGWCSGALTGEAFVRLMASLVVVALGVAVVPLAVASALGALAWTALAVGSRTSRQALATRADCTGRVLAGRMAAATGAQASSALVIVGFPVMLAVTTPVLEYELSAPLLLAITLTRAPILIPLNAYQGVAVSYLVHAGNAAARTLLRLLGLLLVVALVGAVAAWWAGPWIMVQLFGSAYDVPGALLAALTLAAAATAALTLTGASTQALAAHGWFLSGWLVAVAVTLMVLLLPGSVEIRSVLALLLGPLAGLVLHAWGFLARMRRVSRLEPVR